MYLFKNALRNLSRNKGRNILIAFITLTIIIAVSISIDINMTVDSTTKDYKARFGSKVTLFLDTDIVKEYPNAQYPTAKQQMEIAQSDFLQKTDYQASLSVALKDLQALGDSVGGGATFQGGDSLPPVAKVIASSHSNISEEFSNGTRSILSGQTYEKPGECLISEEFSKLNGLSVGDKVTVTNTDEKALMPYSLTICGIYQDNLPQDNFGANLSMINRGNEIITNMDTIMGIDIYAVRGELNSTYYLKDPSMLEAFQKEAVSKGLAPYYRMSTDVEAYHKIVGPVEGISEIVTVFLIVVLIFGGIILLFLSVMAIRERKYEIGVLRAMGMKRHKVIIGIVYESVLIAFVCLIIGLGLSTVISQPIADTLLKDQIQLAQEQKQDTGTFMITAHPETATPISEISIQLTPQAIFEISFIAIMLVLLSSLSGIFYITRFEPMKILSERS